MIRYDIAPTVSSEAKAGLEVVYALAKSLEQPARPTSIEDWDARKDHLEELVGPMARGLADSLGVRTVADVLGDVPVIRIRPAILKPGGPTLIYVHGGGYVILSAKSALALPALVASASGCEVISIDYTLAPRGTWITATDEVLKVWKALLVSGFKPDALGLFGDSAGGGLAAGSVFKMRDNQMPLPGALYLASPWSDLTASGETYTTLADYDPTLTAESLAWGAEVYAPQELHLHPYVSPVYGDYSKPFPPTLIQGGTREIFLSDFVRHYQAIKRGGHTAVLDLYEGMPHVFQIMVPNADETATSIQRAIEFFGEHLARKCIIGCTGAEMGSRSHL